MTYDPCHPEKWVQHLFDAWIAKDFEVIREIFAKCKYYMEDPYYPIVTDSGRIIDLWEEVKAQENIDLNADVLLSNQTKAAYRWRAKFQSEGKNFDLDGVYFVEFDERGFCINFQQWTVEPE